MQKTLILDIVPHGTSRKEAEKNLQELQSLVHTAGGMVIEKIIQKRGRPSAKTFLGTGKIAEAAEYVRNNDIDLVIINGTLKPHQYVHLGNIFPKHIRIWDRIDLILHIFDAHANAPEAKMQIQLARMHHEIPKIYARDATTLFERAGAGIGTRGAGERGIEEEKRHIRRQIKVLEKKIRHFQKKQEASRRARKKTGMPMVALVGYTNAGKSSIMRLFTKKNIRVDDALFVTLETKIGRMWLPKTRKNILLSDTIGFIQNLPHHLLSSFVATLQEVQEADLLLHVIDISDPDYQKKIAVVEGILRDLDCKNIPQIYIFNKIDRCDDFACVEEGRACFLPQKRYENRHPVYFSVKRKKGISLLYTCIEKILFGKTLIKEI